MGNNRTKYNGADCHSFSLTNNSDYDIIAVEFTYKVKNDVLYIAYYDFEDDSWILDENTKTVDTWSEKEIANRISRPNEDHHIVTTDDEDEFEAYSYGIEEDEYDQYIHQHLSLQNEKNYYCLPQIQRF